MLNFVAKSSYFFANDSNVSRSFNDSKTTFVLNSLLNFLLVVDISFFVKDNVFYFIAIS